MRDNRESKFWQQIARGMAQRWVADRIETSVALGVADVSFSVPRKNGHIELKVLPAWPKQATTKIKIDHWTPKQKLWLHSKGRVGGDCWLFVKVEDEYFLFSWEQTYQVETWSRAEWRLYAPGYWKGHVDWKEFTVILVAGC